MGKPSLLRGLLICSLFLALNTGPLLAQGTGQIGGTVRDEQGRLERVLSGRGASHRESVMHFEVDRRLNDDGRADLERKVRAILHDVRLVVRDFEPMQERVRHMIELARAAAVRYAPQEVGETVDFLDWLLQLNFVLLGYREYELIDLAQGRAISAVPASGLGILSDVGRSAFAEPTLLDSLDPAIRARIEGELSLTASVGIGPTKLIAKLASTRAKPDGLLVVRREEVDAFLGPLPAHALWGIGEKTAELLGRLGIRTVGEIAATPLSILERVLGEQHARGLLDLARGLDPRGVVPFVAPKSVSHEETYPHDLDSTEEIEREILSLCHRVAARLRADGYRARTVTLKLRLPSFTTLTRSKTLPEATDVASGLYGVARELFARLPEGRRRFRLIGVAATGLESAAAEQVTLIREGRWAEAERALDRVTKRFGTGAAVPATLLDRAGTRAGDSFTSSDRGNTPGHKRYL